MPASSIASQQASSSSRCWGSITSASRGLIPKNAASNSPASWRNPPSSGYSSSRGRRPRGRTAPPGPSHGRGEAPRSRPPRRRGASTAPAARSPSRDSGSSSPRSPSARASAASELQVLRAQPLGLLQRTRAAPRATCSRGSPRSDRRSRSRLPAPSTESSRPVPPRASNVSRTRLSSVHLVDRRPPRPPAAARAARSPTGEGAAATPSAPPRAGGRAESRRGPRAPRPRPDRALLLAVRPRESAQAGARQRCRGGVVEHQRGRESAGRWRRSAGCAAPRGQRVEPELLERARWVDRPGRGVPEHGGHLLAHRVERHAPRARPRAAARRRRASDPPAPSRAPGRGRAPGRAAAPAAPRPSPVRATRQGPGATGRTSAASSPQAASKSSRPSSCGERRETRTAAAPGRARSTTVPAPPACSHSPHASETRPHPRARRCAASASRNAFAAA